MYTNHFTGPMAYVDIVTALALIQFFGFAFLVGKARAKFGVKAPAVTGHEMFERAFRVQMNTLELLIIFIPGLYLAAKYWSPYLAASVGAVYLIGRIIYAIAYVSNPAGRGLGFALSLGPSLLLIGAGLIGAISAALR